MSDHYAVDFMKDDDGWWRGRCHCGADLGMFPDSEDACDALMEHAYESGALDAAGRIAQLQQAAADRSSEAVSPAKGTGS